MNSKKIFSFILATLALGCAHEASPTPPLRQGYAGQAVSALSPIVDVAAMPVSVVEPKRDDQAIKSDAYEAVANLEKYAASGGQPDQDAIDGFVRTASRSFNAAKGLLSEAERDQLVDKVGVLTQELRAGYALRKLDELRYFNYSAEAPGLTAEEAVADARNAILRAKEAGADVEMLEKQLSGLAQRARATQAKEIAKRRFVAPAQ